MNSAGHGKRDLLIAWTKQCFDAAGLQASDERKRSYAAAAANEIINEGFAGFAEGNSIPHGAGSHTVAGGNAVPGFIAYLNRSVPADEEGRLEAFDEIFQRFVDLTATVEAEGETGVLANAAYNRSLNAANEILQQYFAARTEQVVRLLHDNFADSNSPPIDMTKVTVQAAATTGGCALAAIAPVAVVATALISIKLLHSS